MNPPPQPHDSAVPFEMTPIKTFKSLRLRYDVFRASVGRFLQWIQIKRSPPVADSSTSAQIVVPPTTPASTTATENSKSQKSNSDSKKRPTSTVSTVDEMDTEFLSPAVRQTRRYRPRRRDANNSSNKHSGKLDKTSPPPLAEPKPANQTKPHVRQIKDEPGLPDDATLEHQSIVQITPDPAPVLKLRTHQTGEEPSNRGHRVRRRRSPRTIRHERGHTDQVVGAQMGDSNSSIGSSNSSNDTIPKRITTGEVGQVIGSWGTISSELDIDSQESYETVSLHERPVPVQPDVNNNRPQEQLIKSDVDKNKQVTPGSGYKVVVDAPVDPADSVTELDETDLSRIPILKLRNKSIGFHRTALQHISNSLTKIPSKTRHIFRIRRRVQANPEPPFPRHTVDPGEKEPSNFIFSMLDLKKHRDEQGRHDVGVGVGFIFRRENIRAKGKKRTIEDQENDLNRLNQSRPTELIDPRLFPKSRAFIEPHLLSMTETTPQSERYNGQDAQMLLQPTGYPKQQPYTNQAKLQSSSSKDVNRILAHYSRPEQDPIFSDPLSSFYTRPVFQNRIPEMEPEIRAAEEAKKLAEELAEARDFFPRSSFTAQFAHLLPRARREN